MATLYLFNCPDASGTVAGGVPACSTGTWLQVDASSLSFDLQTWLEVEANQQQFAGYFGAGFGLVCVAFAAGWGVRALLSLIGR